MDGGGQDPNPVPRGLHAQETVDELSYIEEGAFGPVYQGKLNGNVVCMNMANHLDREATSLFQQHLQMITRFWHPNLVPVVGYCINLVKPHDTLANRLHASTNEQDAFRWTDRMVSTCGVVDALEYLHSKDFVHGRLSSSNVFLDCLPESRLLLEPRIPGLQPTLGYSAPEYAGGGEPTKQSDIYAFGVLLLELIMGEKAFDEGRENPLLVDFFHAKAATHGMCDMIARDLWFGAEHFDRSKRTTEIAFDLAQSCIALDPDSRPNIEQVVNKVLRINTALTKESSVDPRPT